MWKFKVRYSLRVRASSNGPAKMTTVTIIASWTERRTHTYASSLSSGLFQPVPTTSVGAAENVGANKVLSVPVGVYVGRSASCVPENEGDIVAGGKGWEAETTGSRVPAAGYSPIN